MLRGEETVQFVVTKVNLCTICGIMATVFGGRFCDMYVPL